jgi:flagellar biosynthetic protein FliR
MIGFTEAQIMAWVTPIFWPFLRILAIFSSAPVLSAKAIPARGRVALSFFIALCAQAIIPEGPIISLNHPAALAVAAQQVVIGLSIGMAARIIFSAVELSGEVIGLQMGLNFAGFFDPSTSSQSSAIGRFFGNTTMLLLVVSNGHLLLIQTVVASFKTFPIGIDLLTPLASMKLHQLGSIMFMYGLRIAMPLIALIMFINLALGFISRVAPQMNIFSAGFPITLSAGLMGIAALLPMLEQPLLNLFLTVNRLFVG